MNRLRIQTWEHGPGSVLLEFSIFIKSIPFWADLKSPPKPLYANDAVRRRRSVYKQRSGRRNMCGGLAVVPAPAGERCALNNFHALLLHTRATTRGYKGPEHFGRFKSRRASILLKRLLIPDISACQLFIDFSSLQPVVHKRSILLS